MEYLKIEGEFPKLANCAVTMGKFDGIHRGHRKLVEKIRERKTLGNRLFFLPLMLPATSSLPARSALPFLKSLAWMCW